MRWVLWRQHRTGGSVASLVLAAFACAVAITGVHMAHVYRSARSSCARGNVCLGHLFSGYGAIIDTVHLTIVLPVLLGAFLGATLISRETEQSTDVLAWTQGTTRCRWVLTKVGFAVTAAIVASLITSVLVTWWSGTTNALDGDRFQGAQFDTQNIVPIAHALFAVALGVAMGAVLRRSLPAIAATVAAYVAVRLLVTVYLRPHYGAAQTITTALGADAPARPVGSWTLSTTILDAAGRRADGPITVPAACSSAGRDTLERCLGAVGYRQVIRFHPASSYWHFQLVETGLYGAAALALIAVAIAVTLRRDT